MYIRHTGIIIGYSVLQQRDATVIAICRFENGQRTNEGRQQQHIHIPYDSRFDSLAFNLLLCHLLRVISGSRFKGGFDQFGGRLIPKMYPISAFVPFGNQRRPANRDVMCGKPPFRDKWSLNISAALSSLSESDLVP